MTENPEQAKVRIRSNPDPVNMPSTDVVCWECGQPRRTSRDGHGHAYCNEHRDLWGLPRLVPSPRQLRDSANGPWEGEE